jgi:HlyD family secretion protein
MQKRSIRRILPAILTILVIGAAVVYLLTLPEEGEGPLHASGTVEVVEVNLASEMAGRVLEVFVEEGSIVEHGDPLFSLDDEVLQAQRARAVLAYRTAETQLDSAQAAVETAEAALHASQVNSESLQIQYELILAAARLEEIPTRIASWNQRTPYQFSLPAWYFQRTEELLSAEEEVNAALETLKSEMENLEEVIQESSDSDFYEVEQRLLEARTAFRIAEAILDRAKIQGDDELEEAAQDSFDAADSELEAAQEAYEDLFSEDGEEQILEAKARVAIAQEYYDAALDRFYQLRTGEDSLQVQAAENAILGSQAAIKLAEAQLAQAEINLVHAKTAIEQTQAEIDLIDLQIRKLVVYAPASGIIRSRNIEPGEVLQPGAPALTLDRSDTLTITVYIPENKYGQILLGSHAQVTVDSFPEVVFDAVITRIAEKAEFTPRNVQTEEGRRTTVFAVQLSVRDSSGKLKPGMPADVTFHEVD